MKLKPILTALCLMAIGCSRDRQGEIVQDVNGVYYELTVPAQLVWPTEAYRLTPIDTNKFIVKGFNQ